MFQQPSFCIDEHEIITALHFQASVDLNNIGIGLAERLCFLQALDTFNDAIDAMKDACMINAMMFSVALKEKTIAESWAKINAASHRLLYPSPIASQSTNYVVHVTSFSHFSSTLKEIMKSKAAYWQKFVYQRDQVLQYSPSCRWCHRNELYLVRIDTTTLDFKQHRSLTSAILLFNFSVAFRLMASAVASKPALELIRDSYSLLQQAHNILSQHISNSENEHDLGEHTMPLSIVILTGLVDLSELLGLDARAVEYRRSKEQLAAAFMDELLAVRGAPAA